MPDDDTRPDRLGTTPGRLSRALRWPPWRDHPDPSPDVSADRVAAAIAAARHVGDGGPYVKVFRDVAVETAVRQERDGDRRPLAGVPIAVKDLVAVANEPLGAGSAVRDDAPPERHDAAVVARLRGLGAIPTGRVALHEFAYGVTGVNEHQGFPRNPHGPDHIPGGSSSGSAVAVADGSAVVAIGTDTGGSVRIPAALCGVVGFKPARGTYSTEGVFPLAPSLDHVGLLAAEVTMIETVHVALGHAPAAEGGLRVVGIVEDDLEAADADVATRVEGIIATLERGGARIRPVAWPDTERSFATSTAIMFSEASAVHRDGFERNPERYGPDVRRRLEAGFVIDAPTYVAAKREQAVLEKELLRLLDGVDAVVTPTVPMVAPTVDTARDADVSTRLVRNTRLANVGGIPAASIPAPGDGLPVGVQILARSNALVLGAAHVLEALR